MKFPFARFFKKQVSLTNPPVQRERVYGGHSRKKLPRRRKPINFTLKQTK